MNTPFLKIAGVTLLMGLASLQVQAASSDDFVDAATEAGIAEVVKIGSKRLVTEDTIKSEIEPDTSRVRTRLRRRSVVAGPWLNSLTVASSQRRGHQSAQV